MNNSYIQKLLLVIALLVASVGHADDLQIQKENSDFFNQLDQIVQSVSPRKDSRWGVSKLSLNASKSHDGIFGILPFKGTATATLSWIPKNSQIQSLETSANDLKSFSLESSNQDGKYAATSWYREFLRTKKLPWSSENEKEFLTLFSKARSIAQDIAQVYHPKWYVDQFIVERGLSVNGALAPLVSADAKFAIRFSFDLQSVSAKGASNQDLTNLVLGLCEDLSASANQFSLPMWSVDGFNLGLGVSPLLGVGVVSAKPFAFAHLQFKARKSQGKMSASFKRQLKTAMNQEIKLFQVSSAEYEMDTNANEKYFIINRDKFRKGLSAALKMAKSMTQKADKSDSSNKRWRLGQVAYRYEMNIGGELNFVGLKGDVGAEVTLNKQLAKIQSDSSDLFAIDQKAPVNTELKRTLATELQDNYEVLSKTPASKSLTAIETSALLKIKWGIDTSLVDLNVAVIPQVRLKFSPLK